MLLNSRRILQKEVSDNLQNNNRQTCGSSGFATADVKEMRYTFWLTMKYIMN